MSARQNTSSAVGVARRFFRGAGQVFFADDARAGACFVAAVFVGSIACGVTGVVALAVATAVGSVVDGDDDGGVYGFNGFLVGVALAVFRGAGVDVVAVAAAGSAVATLLFALAKKRGVTVFTAPFLVVTWLALLLPIGSAPPALPAGPLVGAPLLGLAQVFLQQSVWSAALVVAGLVVWSFRDAVVAVVSAAAATGLAVFVVDNDVVARGLCGYDAALGAVGYVVVCSGQRGAAIVVGVVCAAAGVAAAVVFGHVGVPSLTAGFVVTLSLVRQLGGSYLWRRM